MVNESPITGADQSILRPCSINSAQGAEPQRRHTRDQPRKVGIFKDATLGRAALQGVAQHHRLPSPRPRAISFRSIKRAAVHAVKVVFNIPPVLSHKLFFHGASDHQEHPLSSARFSSSMLMIFRLSGPGQISRLEFGGLLSLRTRTISTGSVPRPRPLQQPKQQTSDVPYVSVTGAATHPPKSSHQTLGTLGVEPGDRDGIGGAC